MSKSYCVYKHTNNITNRVYIGITSQNPLKRWDNGNGYKQCSLFYNAILKYGWDNFKHEILFDNLSKEEAETKEVELIAFYKSNQRKCGYNLAKGGNCTGKEQLTEEHKKKISEKMRGRKLTDEHKKHLSEKFKGRKMSIEARQKMRAYHLGRTITEDNKNKLIKSRSKSVYQIKDNQIIKQWDNISLAQQTLGISGNHISECCKGKRKSAGGFVWRYANEMV